MAENVQVTAEIIDGVERRTAYHLAGLEVPDGTVYEFNSQTGESKAIGGAPELPSGRALLAHLLGEGRTVRERPVVVAREAAIAEALTDLRAHAEASEEKEVAK
jgi:hypothetical protein